MKPRAWFMTDEQIRKVRELKPNEEFPHVDKKHGRSHYNMIAATGVARPGKTAHERYLAERRS